MKTQNLIPLILALLLVLSQCKNEKEIGPPVLKSIEPSKGFVGDPISIKGENLDNASLVSFNEKISLITQNTNTELMSVVPSDAPIGMNNIVVQTKGGTSNKLPFEVKKEPDNVDPLPPVITKTIPSANYSEYPVLIYGENLSGVLDVKFNDKEAAIFTNNQKVVTTIIPKGLAVGSVTIKLRTKKGISSFNFQVQGPPPNGVVPPNFSIVNIPPPNYVPGISNLWTCGLFSEQNGDQTFVESNSDPDGDQVFNITGIYEYQFDSIKNYNNLNYVEFTNKETGEVFAGQFSSKFNNPCILKMVLISSKTGQISECTFDRSEFDSTCDQ